MLNYYEICKGKEQLITLTIISASFCQQFSDIKKRLRCVVKPILK